MRHERYDCNFGCPVEAALKALGSKWKGLILFHLKDGMRRFNELRRLIPGITQHTLTRQLRGLEEDQIIARIVHPEIPPRVEYELTEFGKTLIPILDALYNWGQEYIDRLSAIRQGNKEAAAK
jgi:DNA-binding HxlR family transcriptional regulator